MKALIVEDNKTLASSIKRVLEQEGFITEIFHDGEQARVFWAEHADMFDVAIIDWMLPGLDGVSLVQTIRASDIHTPVLMLTAKDRVQDKVSGLEQGVDYYLTKPFDFEEVVAAVKALLRRRQDMVSQEVMVGNNLVNLSARTVHRDKTEIGLTKTELAILEYLIVHSNQTVSQAQISEHVYDYARTNWSNSLEVHVKNLRKKLFTEHDKDHIKTVRGQGYRLEI